MGATGPLEASSRFRSIPHHQLLWFWVWKFKVGKGRDLLMKPAGLRGTQWEEASLRGSSQGRPGPGVRVMEQCQVHKLVALSFFIF